MVGVIEIPAFKKQGGKSYIFQKLCDDEKEVTRELARVLKFKPYLDFLTVPTAMGIVLYIETGQ